MRGRLDFTGVANPAGVFASMANPFGQDVILHGAHIEIDTIATGAATLSAGTAADAVTGSQNLFDTLDVHSATGLFNIGHDGGTLGRAGQIWTTTQFLNVAKQTGDVTGVVGSVFFTYSLKT